MQVHGDGPLDVDAASARTARMKALPALPQPKGPRELTGLGCPDCPGVLTVATEQGTHLRFECRIGHVYALRELLQAKEERIEALLWAPITALEELAALLKEVSEFADPSHPIAAYRERAALAVRQVSALRRVSDENVPTPIARDPSAPRR